MPPSPRESDMAESRQPRAEPLRDLGQVEALRTTRPTGSGIFLRAGIVDRLLVAQSLVPRELRLLVVAGHRSTSAPGPCPHTTGHTTGGAVDLTAYVDGVVEPVPWSPSPPPEWPEVARALRAVGMVYGIPWWHWSFGDTRWCEQTGAGEPLYGSVAGGSTEE